MNRKKILSCLPPPSEHSEQKCLMDWWNWQAHPVLQPLLFAIPNGGARDPITGARLKAEGVRPGVPDLFLAIPANGLHGLWIELKRQEGGRLSEAQKNMQAHLVRQGYAVSTCYGMEQARRVICRYLMPRPWERWGVECNEENERFLLQADMQSGISAAMPLLHKS